MSLFACSQILVLLLCFKFVLQFFLLIKIAYKKSTIDAGAHVENCGDNQMASEGKFCHFDVNAIPSQCSVENHFGYQRGDPCVLIKLNKVKIFNIHDQWTD